MIRIGLAVIILLATWSPALDIVTTPEPTVSTTTEILDTGIRFNANLPVRTELISNLSLLVEAGFGGMLVENILSTDEYESAGSHTTVETTLIPSAVDIPIGVELTFWWEVTLSDGSNIATAPEMTSWLDGRFAWKETSRDQVSIMTYAASDNFATYVADETQSTIDRLESRYSLDAIPRLTVWIYDSYSDWAPTRPPTMRESIAGVSYADYALIIGIIPDGNSDEFGRVIPHEVSHQVVAAATRNAWSTLPLWFDEGIATHTQTVGADGFLDMAVRAEARGDLPDIQSLTMTFPYMPAPATMSYAASWSIIEYIEATWGTSGTAKLIDAFARGQDVEEAITFALGISLDELNVQWHTWLREQN